MLVVCKCWEDWIKSFGLLPDTSVENLKLGPAVFKILASYDYHQDVPLA